MGVDVSVGKDAARVGGTSIPANSMEVALSPMKSPMPRYLMSVRMVGGILVVGFPVDGIGFDVEVDVIPFSFVTNDMFVIIALPNWSSCEFKSGIFPEPFA